jgi:hypothetical protein
MPPYGDDIKNAHISKIGKYDEWSGQREMMLGDKLSQIGALDFYLFIPCSSATREVRKQSTAELRRADPAIMVPASMHAALIQRVVNLL